MERDFDKCMQYANTDEGVSRIKDEFEEKVNAIDHGGYLISNFKKLYDMYILETPFSAKALLIGAVLLYFIIPLDAIPDFLFGIGYLDDLIVLQLGLSMLTTFTDKLP